jgi:hypothetical protein
MATTIPAEMQEVDRDEFFATVGQLNVHPRPERDATYWETPYHRQLMGISTPGYMGGKPGEAKRYFAKIGGAA